MDVSYTHELVCTCEPLQVMPEEHAKLHDLQAYIHTKECPMYVDGDDADTLRRHLRGVRLFMTADDVLDILPEKFMVAKPNILGVNIGEDGVPNYIIEWVYTGVTLQLERAYFQSSTRGVITAYAVQQIRGNNEQRKQPKQSERHGSKYRRNRNRRAKAAHNRRK